MPPGNIFKNLEGTLSALFQVGIDRPQIKTVSGGQMEIRNSADSDYAILRVATPVGDDDAVPKYYADSIEKPLIVKRQADCTSALPNNTATRGWVVVTTAGTGASIGDILYDNGTSSGTMSIVTAVEGRTIAVTDALTGGTVTFDPDSVYIWDEDGTEWIKIGDISSLTGALRIIRYVLDNSAQQDSDSQIPANARILEAMLIITTAYSGGATISIGNTATADLFMGTTQNSPQVLKTWTVEQDTDQGGSATVVRTTVSNTPAAGAGVAIVKYSSPNA
jgi:hypothetical protein